jgi:threonine/homoserine/homoserine lactone efflux protein
MPSSELLIAFFTAAAIFAFIPGPGMIYAAAQTLAGGRKTGKRALLEGITVEKLNTKSAMFFLAFLPQFTDPAASLPVWAQFLVLGSTVHLMFALGDVVGVLLASGVVARVGRADRVQRAVQQAGGGILVALGLRLALHKD